MLHGRTAQLKKQANGIYRPDRKECPGVAILFRSHLQVLPSPCLTRDAEKWYKAGRLVMATIHGQSFSVLVFCAYFFSGYTTEAVTNRDQMLHDIMTEIAAHSAQPMILCADLNTDWRQHPFAAHLYTLGWQIPAYLDEHNKPTEVTYRSGEVTSLIDIIAVSGEVPVDKWIATVADHYGTQHMVVSFQIPFRAKACPSTLILPRPVIWGKCKPNASSPVDWSQVHHRVLHNLALLQEDEALHAFSEALLKHMVATVEVETEGAPPHSMPRVRMRQCAARIDQDASTVAHTKLARCARLLRKWSVNRSLPSLATQVHQAVSDLREHSELLVGYADEPLQCSQRVLEHIGKKRDQERKSRVKRWLSTLTTIARRPTSTLYRWLRHSMQCGSIVLQTSGGICSAPSEMFRHMREYWIQISCYPNATWEGPPRE
eukprot:2811820-Amphidinium_carterae.2